MRMRFIFDELHQKSDKDEILMKFFLIASSYLWVESWRVNIREDREGERELMINHKKQKE